MPHPRMSPCFDAAGKTFEMEPEEEMGQEVQQKCETCTLTDKRQRGQSYNFPTLIYYKLHM